MRQWAWACAFALAVTSGPAVAQDLHLDPATVQACLDATRPVDRLPACAGKAARECQARPDGDTTLGITECLMAETAVWGDLMRAALAEQAETLGRNDPKLVPQLDATQTAWAAYRDAQCGLIYGIWIDGSIRTIMAADCQLVMTAQRAVDLRHLGAME